MGGKMRWYLRILVFAWTCMIIYGLCTAPWRRIAPLVGEATDKLRLSCECVGVEEWDGEYVYDLRVYNGGQLPYVGSIRFREDMALGESGPWEEHRVNVPAAGMDRVRYRSEFARRERDAGNRFMGVEFEAKRPVWGASARGWVDMTGGQ